MEEKYYESSRGKVFYKISRCGKENAVWLFFLHGLTADNTLFCKQLPEFEKEYNLFCWDAPAHGNSRPYNDFTYPNACNDLNNIMLSENIPAAVMVGQSMGGYIIQSFIKRYPEKCIGFISIDSCPYGEEYYSKSDKWWLTQVGWMAKLYPFEALKKAVSKNCSVTEFGRENMYDSLCHYEKNELCDLMGLGYANFLGDNSNLEIKCPIVILVGEKDTTGKVISYCRAWNKKTGFEMHIIENAAHNSNIDNPADVNNYIREFMKKFL